MGVNDEATDQMPTWSPSLEIGSESTYWRESSADPLFQQRKNETRDPCDVPLLHQNDVKSIDENQIRDAVKQGIFPEVTLRAAKRRVVVYGIARWYLTARKYGLPCGMSRRIAESQIIKEYDIKPTNLHTHYRRLNRPESQDPTPWFADQLESLWRWYEKTHLSEDDQIFLQNCRNLRQVLLELQDVPTPSLAIEDFTVGDFIGAGDQDLLEASGVQIQYDREITRYQRIKLIGDSSVKVPDLTRYSVPFANTWRRVLDVLDKHLIRYGKEDNGVTIGSGFDCTEAYAHNPGKNVGIVHDVTFSALYHGNGCLDITAQVTPPGKTEDQRVYFKSTGTDYSIRTVDLFITVALRQAEIHN